MQNKFAYPNRLFSSKEISGSIFQPVNASLGQPEGRWLCIRFTWQKLVKFGKLLRLWSQRRRQRLELYSLSDTILKDVGINRLDALQEADKPFWRP